MLSPAFEYPCLGSVLEHSVTPSLNFAFDSELLALAFKSAEDAALSALVE
jgi:hypothetical protein